VAYHEQYVAAMCLLSRCFAIDRSGFVLAHQDFLSNPPSAQVHITTKEPKIAADMVDRNIMTRDSCVNYADITNQRFYIVGLSELALQRAAETLTSILYKATETSARVKYFNKSTQRAQTPPRPKCKPKVIQDSNPNFGIISDSDPDVCRIAVKMLWINCLVASVVSPSFVKINR